MRLVQDGLESLDTGVGERSTETEGMDWKTEGEAELVRDEEQVTNGNSSTSKEPYSGGHLSPKSTGIPRLTSPTLRKKSGEDTGEKRDVKGKSKAIEIIEDEEAVVDRKRHTSPLCYPCCLSLNGSCHMQALLNRNGEDGCHTSRRRHPCCLSRTYQRIRCRQR
jgi:hypothetical protein